MRECYNFMSIYELAECRYVPLESTSSSDNKRIVQKFCWKAFRKNIHVNSYQTSANCGSWFKSDGKNFKCDSLFPYHFRLTCNDVKVNLPKPKHFRIVVKSLSVEYWMPSVSLVHFSFRCFEIWSKWCGVEQQPQPHKEYRSRTFSINYICHNILFRCCARPFLK